MNTDIQSIADRFWARVIQTDDNSCWLWQGYRMSFGYGLLQARKISQKPMTAHRVAYELTYGSIPKGKHVLHHCDNPPCVNPSHLFLGTQRDNNKDRDRKGRTASGDNNGARTHPERNPFVRNRGSGASGDNNGARTHPERNTFVRNRGSGLVGASHPNAKLSDQQVQQLRKEYDAGGITQTALAGKFGITPTHVCRLVRRRVR